MKNKKKLTKKSHSKKNGMLKIDIPFKEAIKIAFQKQTKIIGSK